MVVVKVDWKVAMWVVVRVASSVVDSADAMAVHLADYSVDTTDDLMVESMAEHWVVSKVVQTVAMRAVSMVVRSAARWAVSWVAMKVVWKDASTVVKLAARSAVWWVAWTAVMSVAEMVVT